MQCLKYQKDYLKLCDDNQFIIYRKSRQIGITLFEALWSVRKRLVKKIDHYYISRTERTALQFIKYVKIWCQVLNLIIQEEIIKLDKDTTLTKITMPNGAMICAMPAGIDTVRGLPGDVTQDEAGFHQHAREFYDASIPTTTWGYDFHIISSAGLPGGFFEEMYLQASTTEKSKFIAVQTTIYDALADGLADLIPGMHQQFEGEQRKQVFIDNLKSGMTQEAFAQEYECKARGLGAHISEDEFDKVAVAPLYKNLIEYAALKKASNRAVNSITIGIDIGRKKNFTTVVALEQGIDPEHIGDSLEVVYMPICILVLEKTPYPVQNEIIKGVVNHEMVERVLIDANGIGSQLAEGLADEFGGIVEPYFFTNIRKGVIAERIKRFVQQERLAMPHPDSSLHKLVKDDFISIVRKATNGGQITYEGQAGASHGDIFWGFGLALEAAEGNKGSVNLTTLEQVQERELEGV